jgi:YHS domain-containing protein
MATQTDVVCGMQIEESDKTGQSEYNGQTYYFCSAACKSNFDEEPEEYINQADGFK